MSQSIQSSAVDCAITTAVNGIEVQLRVCVSRDAMAAFEDARHLDGDPPQEVRAMLAEDLQQQLPAALCAARVHLQEFFSPAVDTARLAPVAAPTVPGTPFGGGFYAGRITDGEVTYALIVAPKGEGETSGAWLPSYTDVAGACSETDGAANTGAMAAAGSAIAQWARGLSIGLHGDWYLPSRRELDVMYQHLGPATQGETGPFGAKGDQAFQRAWYWSSTQYSRYSAWVQTFGGGAQDDVGKVCRNHARAVRRFVIR